MEVIDINIIEKKIFIECDEYEYFVVGREF